MFTIGTSGYIPSYCWLNHPYIPLYSTAIGTQRTLYPLHASYIPINQPKIDRNIAIISYELHPHIVKYWVYPVQIVYPYS